MTQQTTTQGGLRVASEAGYEVWEMQFAPANALSPAFLAELRANLTRASQDESITAVVLTSGLRLFSAGADASWMAGVVKESGTAALLEQFIRTMDEFRELCGLMRRSPVLIIAAMNGHTLAGGLELAAACDIRFAADHEAIKIGVPEMDLFGAMPSGGGGAQFLARLMGPSRALHFILDAKPISPRAAYEQGLVDRLVGAADLRAAAEGFAADVARKAGRVGTAAAKHAVLGGAELSLADALALDRAVHWDSIRRGNFRAGVDAFVEQYG